MNLMKKYFWTYNHYSILNLFQTLAEINGYWKMEEHSEKNEKIKYLIRNWMMKLKYRFYIQQQSSISKSRIKKEREKFLNRFISYWSYCAVCKIKYFFPSFSDDVKTKNGFSTSKELKLKILQRKSLSLCWRESTYS